MFECATGQTVCYIISEEPIILFDNATKLFGHVTGFYIETVRPSIREQRLRW
jgi:hypothetical protein